MKMPAVCRRGKRPQKQVTSVTATSPTSGMSQSLVYWLNPIPTIIQTASGSSGA